MLSFQLFIQLFNVYIKCIRTYESSLSLYVYPCMTYKEIKHLAIATAVTDFFENFQ